MLFRYRCTLRLMLIMPYPIAINGKPKMEVENVSNSASKKYTTTKIPIPAAINRFPYFEILLNAAGIKL